MNEGQGQKIYYPALDGMRGVAILLVIAYHNFTSLSVSHFGWLGVDLFFVLSGFLITSILLKTFDEPRWLQHFYIKRVLRIFPLYFASLLIFLFVLPALINRPGTFNYYIVNQEWLWFFLQNWLYIFKQPEGAGFLNHFWFQLV
ncbi:MAG: acyltransferase [Bacteroidota bacterium]